MVSRGDEELSLPDESIYTLIYLVIFDVDKFDVREATDALSSILHLLFVI